jgi:hypothetical protein
LLQIFQLDYVAHQLGYFLAILFLMVTDVAHPHVPPLPFFILEACPFTIQMDLVQNTGMG